MSTVLPKLRRTKVSGKTPTAEDFNHLQASTENFLRDFAQNTTQVDMSTGSPVVSQGSPVALGKQLASVTLQPTTPMVNGQPVYNAVNHGLGRPARYHIGQMSGPTTVYNAPGNRLPNQQLYLGITGTEPVTVDIWVY